MYIPKQGDVVWIDFNPAAAGRALILRSLLRCNEVHSIPRQLAARWLIPQTGHEQAGHRSALVISNADFNGLTGFAIVCPITSKRKNYPLHIELKGCKTVSGAVMLEQMKSLDYTFRNAKFAEHVSDDFLREILERIDSFF